MIDGQLYKRGFSQHSEVLDPRGGRLRSTRDTRRNLWKPYRRRALAGKALRQGFFWPTMLLDAHELGWCKGLAIKQFFTSVSNPQANGQTEVTNRTILQHLKTRLGSAKGAWVDELPSVLWAYRTTPRTTTGESPFNLCYGTEAVAPAEIGELSWRVKHYDSTSNAQGMRVNLDLIEEAREKAAVGLLCIKLEWPRRTTPESDQETFRWGPCDAKSRSFGPIGKLDPKWEGPYKVMEIVNAGAYRLQHLNGKNVPRTWNIVNLKNIMLKFN
ncbi:UNVERIFIED_CONTAM: hypothetical protein Sradi_3821700 [Sesamum radiatum]|uniref:Integrase catalytic domain-containing protein n=1 Tax=Sesamum radiatum TaxID=300843 RepID=A0AAW2Q126_SESRA